LGEVICESVAKAFDIPNPNGIYSIVDHLDCPIVIQDCIDPNHIKEINGKKVYPQYSFDSTFIKRFKKFQVKGTNRINDSGWDDVKKDIVAFYLSKTRSLPNCPLPIDIFVQSKENDSYVSEEANSEDDEEEESSYDSEAEENEEDDSSYDPDEEGSEEVDEEEDGLNVEEKGDNNGEKEEEISEENEEEDEEDGPNVEEKGETVSEAKRVSIDDSTRREIVR
jgi:hypothetical protein